MATFTFGVEGKGIPKIIPKLIWYFPKCNSNSTSPKRLSYFLLF
jgi:hypothetical protein